MSTDYTNVNGYLIPSFALPTGSTPPLGKYGAMRARFLDEHRPFERDQMLLDGTLAQHLVRWGVGLQNSMASPRI